MKKESLSVRFLYQTIPGRLVLKVLTRPFLSKAAGAYLDSRLSRWLVPLFIKRHKIDMEGFEKWNGMECIECGSCSYICPAKIPLAQSIRTMKKQILAERRKK